MAITLKENTYVGMGIWVSLFKTAILMLFLFYPIQINIYILKLLFQSKMT